MVHRSIAWSDNTTLLGNARRMLSLPAALRDEVLHLDAEHHFDAIHYLNMASVLCATPGKAKQFATVNSHQPFCPKGNLFYKEK